MFISDPREKMLTEFNKLHQLEYPLLMPDVRFSQAGVWLQGQCNARVTVTALTTSVNFTGAVVMHYNRYRGDLELRDINLGNDPTVFPDVYSVLAHLRTVYGLPMLDTDFTNFSIAPTAAEVSLTPKVDAQIWLPPYPIVLKFDSE